MRRTTVLVERFATLDGSFTGTATARMRSTLHHHGYGHTGCSVFASPGAHMCRFGRFSQPHPMPDMGGSSGAGRWVLLESVFESWQGEDQLTQWRERDVAFDEPGPDSGESDPGCVVATTLGCVPPC
jgi:hypothetical protein